MDKNQFLPGYSRGRNRNKAVSPRKNYEPLWSRTHESNGVNHRRASFPVVGINNELDLINGARYSEGYRRE